MGLPALSGLALLMLLTQYGSIRLTVLRYLPCLLYCIAMLRLILFAVSI